MSVFVDKNSRVAVQGMTGKEGSYWTKLMKDMGTQVVFGCTPGKEGQDVAGIPVYHTMRRGMKDHPADVSMVFVPLRFVRELERGKETVQLDKVNLVLKLFGEELKPSKIEQIV